jgi:hypothetical protein
MIVGEEFHNIIGSVFDDVKKLHQSEQVQINCPKCQERDNLPYPDGKYNLEINTKIRKFRCWKCDFPPFSGSLAKLIRMYGKPADYELYKSLALKIDPFATDKIEREITNVYLPSDMIKFADMDVMNPNHMEAYQYMVLDRKIDREQLLKYNIGFCLEGRYKDRVVVPSYDKNGDVNFFVTRTFKKGIKPKYLNPVVDKSLIIFNEANIDWDSTVYIVEGAFDMFSMPDNAVPNLGKDLSEPFIKNIKKYKPYIIIVLDADAFVATINTYYIIKNMYFDCPDKVKFVILDTHKDKFGNFLDIDEIRVKYGKEEVAKELRKARVIQPSDIEKFKPRLRNNIKPYYSMANDTTRRRFTINREYFKRK